MENISVLKSKWFNNEVEKLMSKGLSKADIARSIDVMPQYLNSLTSGVRNLTDQFLDKFIEKFNINQFDLLPHQENISYDPSIGVPYYDVDFIGGFNQIFNDQTTLPAHNIVFKPYEDATLWCNVTGHSMEQKICHGDIIAIKECTLNDIQYGEIYAVVLDTIRTVKVLRKSFDPQKLRFVPINIAEYDEQEFDISRIIKVYEVLGSISKFF